MIKEFENSLYGKVRTAIIEEQACFNLKDITNIYGIKSVNQCRSKIPSKSVKTLEVKSSTGVSKNMYFVTADQLSNLMFQSTRTEAEGISDWLYRTVLPQMMKYQAYRVEDFLDPDKIVSFLEDFEDLRIRNNIVETQIKLNAPKLEMINKLLGTNNCFDLAVVHEVIGYHGLKSTELLKILRVSKILDDNNQPLQEFCDKRYFRVVHASSTAGPSVITNDRVYVYKSGITFIEKIVKAYGGSKDDRKNKN